MYWPPNCKRLGSNHSPKCDLVGNFNAFGFFCSFSANIWTATYMHCIPALPPPPQTTCYGMNSYISVVGPVAKVIRGDAFFLGGVS